MVTHEIEPLVNAISLEQLVNLYTTAYEYAGMAYDVQKTYGDSGAIDEHNDFIWSLIYFANILGLLPDHGKTLRSYLIK